MRRKVVIKAFFIFFPVMSPWDVFSFSFFFHFLLSKLPPFFFPPKDVIFTTTTTTTTIQSMIKKNKRTIMTQNQVLHTLPNVPMYKLHHPTGPPPPPLPILPGNGWEKKMAEDKMPLDKNVYYVLGGFVLACKEKKMGGFSMYMLVRVFIHIYFFLNWE